METIIINETGNDNYDTKLEKSRAIVIDDNNKIYVCNMRGSYILPGGTIDSSDKTADETIKRELKEELGIENSTPIKYKTVYYYHEGHPKYKQEGYEKRLNIVHYYILKIDNKDIGTPAFTEYEKSQNMKIEAYSIEELIRIYKCLDMNNKWNIFAIKELDTILNEYIEDFM